MTPQQPDAYEVAMKKIQWSIDYHALRLEKYTAAKKYLEEHPEAVRVVEGFTL